MYKAYSVILGPPAAANKLLDLGNVSRVPFRSLQYCVFNSADLTMHLVFLPFPLNYSFDETSLSWNNKSDCDIAAGIKEVCPPSFEAPLDYLPIAPSPSHSSYQREAQCRCSSVSWLPCTFPPLPLRPFPGPLPYPVGEYRNNLQSAETFFTDHI